MFHLELLVTVWTWGHDSTISSRRCDGLGRIHQHLQMVGFPLYCHVSFGGCIFLSFQPSKIHHNTSRGCLKHLCWCWHQSINHLLWCCFLQKTAAKNPPFWGVKGRIVESGALVSLGCWTRVFFSFGQFGYLFVKLRHRWWWLPCHSAPKFAWKMIRLCQDLTVQWKWWGDRISSNGSMLGVRLTPKKIFSMGSGVRVLGGFLLSSNRIRFPIWRVKTLTKIFEASPSPTFLK